MRENKMKNRKISKRTMRECNEKKYRREVSRTKSETVNQKLVGREYTKSKSKIRCTDIWESKKEESTGFRNTIRYERLREDEKRW